MLRRGIIDEATFEQIIREGHTKIKYTADYVAMQNHVLPHLNYVEARVRGYIDNAAMYAGGKAHRLHARPDWTCCTRPTAVRRRGTKSGSGLQRGGKLLSATDDLTAASTGIDPRVSGRACSSRISSSSGTTSSGHSAGTTRPRSCFACSRPPMC